MLLNFPIKKQNSTRNKTLPQRFNLHETSNLDHYRKFYLRTLLWNTLSQQKKNYSVVSSLAAVARQFYWPRLGEDHRISNVAMDSSFIQTISYILTSRRALWDFLSVRFCFTTSNRVSPPPHFIPYSIP